MNTDERDPQTYALIGAAMEVHRVLGQGFLESVYQEALAMEFSARGIPFEREALLTIDYKGRRLKASYRTDFLCFDNVIAELKALPSLSTKEEAQTINCLKASGHGRALLLNFGAYRLEYKRIVH